MAIFGTIGLFVRNIDLPSSVIAMARGLIGAIFLLIVIAVRRTDLSKAAIGKNLPWLCLSGAAIGFNWILLFESYRYTTVATSTLCYYMAPVLVILVSPLIVGERLTVRKILCVIASLIGMVCISGVLDSGVPEAGEGKGILLGLAAAVLYAAVVLMNKQMKEIPAFDKTILQLGISAAVMLAYCAFTVPVKELNFTLESGFLLLLVGVIHTGLAYYFYFGALGAIRAQTAAIISYVDPVIAVLASFVILGEPLGPFGWIGAGLILGAALVSEISSS